MAATPHGSAVRRFLAGMARCAALYFSARNIRPTSPPDLAEIEGPAGVGALLPEVKRSAASHEGNKAPRFAGRVHLRSGRGHGPLLQGLELTNLWGYNARLSPGPVPGLFMMRRPEFVCPVFA